MVAEYWSITQACSHSDMSRIHMTSFLFISSPTQPTLLDILLIMLECLLAVGHFGHANW